MLAMLAVSITAPAADAARGEPVRVARAPAPAFDLPLAHAPLDTPLVVTGGFGEYRVGHFHAGLDFGTGRRVGRPVFAPLGGWIERVRSSGVGYGRSIYLHTDDGRLIQFGHLDAFAEPLASYVAAVQESTGQYEQDLWPERRRFPVHAGERIAWTGQSGAGGPHMHFEIRRGDMALNPWRAGLAGLGVRDAVPPSLVSVTFEPLDDTSHVQRGARPYTAWLGARPDTLIARGRLRAVVGARDGVWSGVDRMVPWSVAMEWNHERIACDFDSVSWATDTPQSDYVYDAGRVVGERGLVLWAPPLFRPRSIRTARPQGRDAGTILVRPGEPARPLLLVARDAAGNAVERVVVLRGETREERMSYSLAEKVSRTTWGASGSGARGFSFSSLGGRWVRVTYRGAPPGTSRIVIEAHRGPTRRSPFIAVPATFTPGECTAVLDLSGMSEVRFDIVGRRSEGTAFHDSTASLLVTPAIGSAGGEKWFGFGWSFGDSDASFDSSLVFALASPREPAAAGELTARSGTLELMPGTIPLRRAIAVRFKTDRAQESEELSHAGLFRDRGDGWEFVSAAYDSVGQVCAGDSRYLGRFAVFRDTRAPRIAALPAPAPAQHAPYARWALEAKLTDDGSGVDARGSYFVIDGRRVPSEWDSEESTLRWRPLRRPRQGHHRYEIVAADRTGNVGRAEGSFAAR